MLISEVIRALQRYEAECLAEGAKPEQINVYISCYATAADADGYVETAVAYVNGTDPGVACDAYIGGK